MNNARIGINRDEVRLVVTTVDASLGIGVHQLRITVELTTRAARLATAQMWQRGNVCTSGLGAYSGYLAPLRADIQPITLVAPGGHNTVSLVADFDQRQLEVIERERNGGLTFQFQFSGYVIGPDGTTPFWNVNIDHVVEQSNWIVLVLSGWATDKLCSLSLKHRNLPQTNPRMSPRHFATFKRHTKTTCS